MPADRASLAYHHDNMIGSPAGDTNVRVIWRTEDGILLAYGTTVPSDEDEGYDTGCLFFKTDGGDGTSLYVNEGTESSANFNAITVAA